MRKTLLLSAFLFVLSPPLKAHASFYMECAVHAVLKETETESLYKADIVKAIVTGGHTTKGEPCMPDALGTEIDIKLEEKPALGKNIRLKYSFSNSMSPEGVVNSELWELWPLSYKDILPW